MREKIENLVRLQGIDNEARGARLERDGLRDRIQRLKDLLVVARRGLDDKAEKLGEASRFHREKDDELKADQEKVNRARGKLQAVTKNKEYMAMQKEIEALRRSNGTREEEILKLLTAIEEFKLSIAAEQEKIATLEGDVANEEARNATRLAELDARIDVRSKEREGIQAQLPRDLTERYAKIAKARDGLAITPVRKGACSGCNFMVPPQQVLKLQKLETLESCRSCSRFLYWVEPEKAVAAPEAA